mgnify:CR=1 FL=1
MKVLVALLAAASFGAVAATAATIERVQERGNVVVIKLAPEEVSQFSKGEVITIQTRTAGAPIEGQIKKIKNGRAFVKVSDGKSVQKGKAEVAALGGTTFSDTVENTATVAEDRRTPYREPTFSQFFVSPAQVYQVKGFRTDFQLALVNDDWGYKVEGIEAKVSQTGPTISAAAIKRLSPRSHFRLGIHLEREQRDLRFEVDADSGFADESGSIGTNRAAPVLAYSTDNMTFAASYVVRQTRFEGEFFQTSHSFNYGKLVAGILYHNPTTEAGLYAETKVDETSKGQTDAGADVEESIEEPLTVGVHGRHYFNPAMAVHSRVAFQQNNAFNKDPEDTEQRNNWIMEAGVRNKMSGKSYLDVVAFGNTPAYVNDREKSPTTIVTYGAGLGYFFPYAKRHLIGAEMKYQRGEDDFKDDLDDKVKINRDVLTIGVQGAVAL